MKPDLQPYNLDRWSENFVACDDHGSLLIQPQASANRQIPLQSLLQKIEQTGMSTPVLIRFPEILHTRVNQICDAFNQAAEYFQYQGQYTVVYPIKVNQQRRVVEEIVNAEPAASRQQVGLEAGSKPELLALLAVSHKPGAILVCNGYKDRHYIELALLGQKLGQSVYIVVEKLSELPLILELSKSMGVTPQIGLRVRLSTVGKGNWQNTGGEKSKFGLSAQQLLQAIELLKQEDALDTLCMLHFHLGSQIANLGDIRKGMQECARYYEQLRKLGIPIRVLDIGGGLGVDYEGTCSQSACSMNYSIGEYARCVVEVLAQTCRDAGLPQPDIISESGRALSAHHAVLVTDICEIETPAYDSSLRPQSNSDPLAQQLQQLRQRIQQQPEIVAERADAIYLEARHLIESSYEQFSLGQINLTQKSGHETLYTTFCFELRSLLEPHQERFQQTFDHLNELLSEKLFLNMSVFQSIPDVWGIAQIFPILPLSGLNLPHDHRVMIKDITCDSDGRIDRYVNTGRLKNTLKLPIKSDSKHNRLGIFMVGAYQEILGDMHNLFGDTNSVDVWLDKDGKLIIDHVTKADTVARVLRYVNFEEDYLRQRYRKILNTSNLDQLQQQAALQILEDALERSTYLDKKS